MTDILLSKINKLKKKLRRTNKFVNNIDERLIIVEESLRSIRNSVADYSDTSTDEDPVGYPTEYSTDYGKLLIY